MSHRRASVALGLVVVLLGSAPLRADDTMPSASENREAVAAETFRAGKEAFARGDFNAAALSFDMASQLAPHAAAIYNAARAWQEVGDLPRAADRYHAALQTEQLSEAQRTEGQAQYETLLSKLGKLSIVGPDGSAVTVEHVSEMSPLPLVVHLRPGEHRLEVRFADGSLTTKVVEATAGMDESILVPPPEDAPSDQPAILPKPKTQPVSSSSPVRPIGFVLAGLGLAAGGAAVGLGLGALSARDDYDASGNTDLDARDQAATLRTLTNVAWIGAGVLTAVGVVFIVIGGDADDSSGESAGLKLQVGPSEASFEFAF